ncbi:MAG: hypothetical protein ACK5WW_10260 [Brevundimonas sp.]|uniref:hypothetical protein n=1 Tax=Brevundimonas sp. TaxID=1871086 RepID=UPI0022C8295B|nr:hypothetical protein [Brevundimonas sp.]
MSDFEFFFTLFGLLLGLSIAELTGGGPRGGGTDPQRSSPPGCPLPLARRASSADEGACDLS